MNNRERMKAALSGHKAAKPSGKPPAAAAKKPEVPKKPNPRSAAARDARAKARGRLPQESYYESKYLNGQYVGRLVLHTVVLGGDPGSNPLVPVKEFRHSADGLFRFMEELDVMFWNWFAADGDGEIKRLLTFDPVDRKPEPMPADMKGGGE